jgi:hypothetical protein
MKEEAKDILTVDFLSDRLVLRGIDRNAVGKVTAFQCGSDVRRRPHDT